MGPHFDRSLLVVMPTALMVTNSPPVSRNAMAIVWPSNCTMIGERNSPSIPVKAR